MRIYALWRHIWYPTHASHEVTVKPLNRKDNTVVLMVVQMQFAYIWCILLVLATVF